MRCADNIYGVILAGGEGQRLWPISRKEFPKYCLRIGDSRRSLLQEAYERLRCITTKDKIFIVTQKAQARIIKRQLPALSVKNIIAEPLKRNTAAAVGIAALAIGKHAPDAVMAVIPADQFIPDKDAFCGLMKYAAEVACFNNSLVTIGIKPTCPATGYGYIKVKSKKLKVKSWKAYKAARFVEKPNLQTAKRFIKAGYLWNSGMFVWEVTAILEAIRDCSPKLFKALVRMDKAGRLIAPSLGLYKTLDNISIDKAVLERSKNVFVIPSQLKWDDVGSWLSLTRLLKPDKDGNIINANFKGIDTKNCIVVSKTKRHLIAGYGLKDIAVIQSPDATLVCSAAGAERLRELVGRISRDKKMKGFC